jgi:bile acid-coenzyme A ligase
MDDDFVSRIRQLADADPDRAALTCGDQTLTRAEFVERIHRLAALFAAHGVAQGATVTIGLPNSIGFVESMFPAWALGAVPQPISNRLPPVERAAIIALADPALAVGVLATEAGGRPTLVAVPEDLPAGSFTPGVAPVWKIMSSGGSTGQPKLIAANAPARFETVAPIGKGWLFPENGSVLVPGPLAHNGPFLVAAVALMRGNHLIVMPRFDAAGILELIERYRVNWLYLVPTMMLRIWRLPEAVRLAADLSSLEVAFHVAAPCPAWLKEAWIDWLGPEKVLEIYGGTEAQAVTVITGTEWLAHRGSVGRPMLGEMQVRDDDGRPLPPLAVGEIWMRRGAGAAPVYHYIGATARAADDGWESLGDIGYLDGDGYLYITDRMSDMILVGGANVYPAEIEAALDEHPAVRSCCVIGLPDEDLGNIPHAIVELADPVTDEELMAHLRQQLAPYKLPRTIERTTTPLRDEAGKVRRSALRSERLARLAPQSGS